MTKLKIDAVLQDMSLLLRRDLSLTLSVGALFFFLPSFIFYGLVPQSIPPQAEDSFAALREMLIYAFLIPSLLLGTFTSIGTVIIIRIWFQQSGATVADALRYGLTLIPIIVALHVAINVGVFGGMLLLLIPGIYVSVRMMMAMALLADQPFASPAAAWRDCWALSTGNGVPIFFLMLIVGMATLLLAFVLGLVDGSMAPEGAGGPMVLVGLTNGVVTLIGAMLSAAMAAASYRRLRIPNVHDVFS